MFVEVVLLVLLEIGCWCCCVIVVCFVENCCVVDVGLIVCFGVECLIIVLFLEGGWLIILCLFFIFDDEVWVFDLFG